MADQATSPVVARHASTVLLLRDSDRGVEVFMERRHIQSDFVGGAYVFPGGRVDPEDRVDESLCHGLTDHEASARLALEEGGLTFYVAAIRECFEEAGVLMAYDRDGQILDFSDRAVEEHFERLRAELNAGERSLLDIAAAERLTLATDRISYWAHWITPEGQPRRYDTRFFVTRAPQNQTAAHDDHELTSSAWVTAGEALERGRRKEWMIIFPTIRNLQKLSRFESADAAIAAVDAQESFPVMQPRVLMGRTPDESARPVLPGDEGYEEAAMRPSAANVKDWQRAFSR
ncbi:MAG: NUDIX hydrolase [Holophagales bacterium]|nr:NUDIX hydrolase [Holophagales bacterium]MYF05075.1 NUDIX hydrolase [Holophagales bacterium]MYJ24233.1 NUDIX hydrolase [Holophagales bacterium]